VLEEKRKDDDYKAKAATCGNALIVCLCLSLITIGGGEIGVGAAELVVIVIATSHASLCNCCQDKSLTEEVSVAVVGDAWAGTIG